MDPLTFDYLPVGKLSIDYYHMFYINQAIFLMIGPDRTLHTSLPVSGILFPLAYRSSARLSYPISCLAFVATIRKNTQHQNTVVCRLSIHQQLVAVKKSESRSYMGESRKDQLFLCFFAPKSEHHANLVYRGLQNEILCKPMERYKL